jgi:hypothetical protein
VFHQAIIILFYFGLDLYLMISRATTLLLYMSAEPEGLGSTAWISPFVASIGKFRLEGASCLAYYLLLLSLASCRMQVLSTLRHLAANEPALTYLAFEAD